MTPNLNTLLSLVLETIRQPREGARTVLAMRPERSVLWQMLALIVVLSVLMSKVVSFLTGGTDDGDVLTGPLLNNPFLATFIQGALLTGMVFAVHFIGRAFGGEGEFDEALTLVIWLQFILLVIQVIQTVAMLVFPALGLLIAIASIALFLWLLVHFVALIHGFDSLGLVFAGIMVSAFGLLFLFSLLLAMLGLSIPGELQ